MGHAVGMPQVHWAQLGARNANWPQQLSMAQCFGFAGKLAHNAEIPQIRLSFYLARNNVVSFLGADRYESFTSAFQV